MRRLVLICMMLILPLQWTWAATAAYCAHESGASARHVGHHEHVHQGAASDPSVQVKAAQLGDLDPDCGSCHLGAAQGLPVLHEVLLPSTGSAPLPKESSFPGSHIGSGPERPDRALAA